MAEHCQPDAAALMAEDPSVGRCGSADGRLIELARAADLLPLLGRQIRARVDAEYEQISLAPGGSHVVDLPMAAAGAVVEWEWAVDKGVSVACARAGIGRRDGRGDAAMAVGRMAARLGQLWLWRCSVAVLMRSWRRCAPQVRRHADRRGRQRGADL